MAKLRVLTEKEMLKYKRRFMKLNEYSFVNKEDDLLLDEADDDEPQGNVTPPADGQMPPADGQMPPADGQMPPADGQMPPADGQMPPADGQMPPTDGQVPPMSNEVEVDVTDLTSKQDDIDSKVNRITDETASIMDMLASLTDKLENVIKKTDQEMKTVRDEIIKRNPTPVEVLQKRITVSDPFSETPADYWKKKEAEGHYKLSDNEDDEYYKLKASDIDVNNREIYRSFGITDDEMNQSIATMFKI